MQLNPYLSFNGQCEAALKFYQQVLGGEIVAMMHLWRNADGRQTLAGIARQDHPRPPRRWRTTVLMASDSPPDHYEPMKGISVTLNIDEPAEAERVFHALAAGGTVTMPIEETFWARRFGMLTDRFGTPWMINCEKPM